MPLGARGAGSFADIADADPEYRYRMDSLHSLRGLTTHFSPRRWDTGSKPWPHRSLLAAQQTKPTTYGLYRLSFWINEAIARHKLAGWMSGETQVLLRVRISTLVETFKGWNFEEDDWLPGEADLIWSCEPAEDDDAEFKDSGLLLDDIEIWVDAMGWRRWHDAEPLWAESARMARAGWSRAAYVDIQGRPGSCYWQVMPDPRQDSTEGVWCLLTSDELFVPGLENNHQALREVLSDLARGPLAPYAGAICGALLVDVARLPLPEIMTQQRAIRWQRREHNPAPRMSIRRLLGGVRSEPSALEPFTELRALLTSQQVRELISRSSWRLAKDISDATWRSLFRV